MALPSSGTLGMNQIRVELGIPSQAPFSLDTAENGGYVPINQCSPSKPNPSNPAAISEWYGYNHAAACYNLGGFKYSTTSCTAACNLGSENANLWSCCSTLAVNCRVWANSSCSTLPGVGYYSNSNSTTCYQVDDGGTVVAVTACPSAPTTTTTTAAPCGGNPCYFHTGWSFAGDCTTACAGPFTFTFYSCCSTISTACSINSQSNCSGYSPPISGYLSNGSVCYTVNGNQLDSVVSCAPTTTTTVAPGNCTDHQATASGFMTWTDCFGNPQNQFLIVGDIFCAQVGTVIGNYIDLNLPC